MNTFYGWVDPGFLQGMLVAFLMTAVSAVALIVVLALIANRNVVAGIFLLCRRNRAPASIGGEVNCASCQSLV